jgi:endoglucanase
VMGWVYLDPECEYLQRLKPVLDAKRALDTDFWIEWSPDTPAKAQIVELSQLVCRTIPDPNLDWRVNNTYLRQASLANYVGELMQPAYAQTFVGLSEVEIDRVLQSFRVENCLVREDLLAVVGRHLKGS